MRCKTSSFRALAILCLIWTAGVRPVFGGDLKILHGHVPAVISQLKSIGDVPTTNELQLAIGLPLRDQAGLDNFLKEVYDPASPNFHHYLTPEEFTARFGPTEADYAAVKNFARANGFQITGTHGNRLLLDVRAKVADIQRAFHINLRRFKHPSEARDFFAPDTEPTVDFDLPVADVSGLSDYKLPKPLLLKKNSVAGRAVAKSGSAPTGDFLGDDFRAAYVPDTTLTGAGQSVGLLEFDGFYTNDIIAYAKLAGGGRTNIAVKAVLLDGYNGKPTSFGNDEVSLDIEMAMATAPGLAKILVFSGNARASQNDLLNAMVASNAVKNLSCSWGWGGGPSTTTDAIFQQMSAQGQSFFNASGDSDAFTTGATSANGVDNVNLQNAPSSSPYIIQVGGTTLVTAGPGGAWQSESVWNWGGGTGSSGGISSSYSIPGWQASVSMANNLGSTTKRNIPDVAMDADNIYIISGGSGAGSGGIGGTSCAAPLWAGLMALVNQQAVADGKAAVGFINPLVYAIGAGANYADDFHDIAKGDNTWSKSPTNFYAVNGYDLCTGWGTPAGQALIDALVGQGGSGPVTNTLEIFSNPQLAAAGAVDGPFNPASSIITLTNSGTFSLPWTLLNPNAAAWLAVSPVSGVLGSQSVTNVTVSFTAAVANLAVGNYSASFSFVNPTSAVIQYVTFQLQVLPVLSVQPAGGLNAIGPVGGPFIPPLQNFTLSNLGGTSAVWKISKPAAWLTASAAGGTVAAGGQTNFIFSFNAKANKLKAGIYKTTVTLRNKKNQVVQSLPVTLSVGQNVVANGGFETGDFTGWTVNAISTSVGNRTGLFHSGKYGAQLGQSDTLGYLSQTLPTTGGQTYLLSLWLTNPKNSTSTNATPNEFQVQWEGVTIYDAVNLPFTAWTNLQFTVTAANSGSLLQFGFRDDPYYLGLDDISVKPVAAPHISMIIQTPAAFHFTFDTTPGATYQAQYKTNLVQPDWIDLGAPVVSETNSLQFSDPDIANYPQKFYRLKLVP